MSLDQGDLLLEQAQAPALEEVSEFPLQGDNGPALPVPPSPLQQLPGLLLQEHLGKGSGC